MGGCFSKKRGAAATTANSKGSPKNPASAKSVLSYYGKPSGNNNNASSKNPKKKSTNNLMKGSKPYQKPSWL